MLQIYSDACHRPGDVGFVAVLVLRDEEEQLTFFGDVYSGIVSSTAAEIMGVTRGLEWVLNNGVVADHITVYTDNSSVVNTLQSYLRGNICEVNANMFLWYNLFHICDKLKDSYIEVKHVYGHQSEHNPNKACDMLCSGMAYHYKSKELGTCTQS